MAEAIDQRSDWARNLDALSGHAIVGGFGVPGRAVVEWLVSQQIPHVIIEQNPEIVNRCSRPGMIIISGSVEDEPTLRRAGIERAAIFAIAVPSEAVALRAVATARGLNPTVRIIARCTYISGGMEAARRGANDTIVAEEITAREFVRLLQGGHAAIHGHAETKQSIP